MVHALAALGQERRVRGTVVEGLEQLDDRAAERAEDDLQPDRHRLAVHEHLVEGQLIPRAQEGARAQARAQVLLRCGGVAHDHADVKQVPEARRRDGAHPCTPSVSTTHTASPTRTSLPSGTACSTMTPSPVASTSWLIFSVSIS